MATTPGIMLDIGANVARMQADMRNIVGTMESGFSRIQSLAQKVGISLSAAFIVHEAIQFGDQVLKDADRLTKLSQSTSITVENLSALKYAAGMADIDLESLAHGVERLSRNMIDAQAGTGEAKDAIKAMGLTIQDTGGNLLSSDKVLGQIADKFASYGESTERTGLAIKLFGRAGAELIPLLAKGSSAIADLRAEAEKLGLVMSTETAEQMERVNDNFKRLHNVTQGIAVAIMTGLAPTLENLTNILFESKKETGDFAIEAEALATALKLLASAGIITWTAFKDVGTYIGAAGAAIAALAGGDLKGAAEIMKMEAKDVDAMWSKTGQTLSRIWDKSAEDALRSADKIRKGTGKAPALPTEDEKAIEKILKKLQEEVEAIQMGSDALELYKKGLHEATAEQKDFGLGLIRTIEAYEQTKKSMLDRAKAEEEDRKAIQENENAILGIVDAMKMQAITAAMDEEETAKFQLTLKGASKTMIENVETYSAAIRAARDYRDEIKLLEGIIDETKSPMDRYEERMKEIQTLLDKGMISGTIALQAQGKAWEDMVGKQKETTTEQERLQIEFGKKLAKIKLGDSAFAINEIEREAAIFKNAGSDEVAVAIWAAKEKQKVSREWQDGAIRGLENYAIEATNAAKNTEEVFTHAFKNLEDDLVNFLKTGKLNFSSFVNALETDLARLAVRQAITGPLAAGLAASFSGWGGAIASIFGGGAGGGVNQNPSAWGGQSAAMMHGGGIVGPSGGMSRSLSAALMSSAPRYHGGLQPDEFPSILRRGEGVFTPEQMKALGGRTNISIAIPVTAGAMDPRKAGQMRKDLEAELEPTVRRIVGRYI
jgi:lambda family phage tail tape measure protein